MFLEDKFADVKLLHEDGEAFEVWWFYDSSVLAVSHCPNNYPSTIVHSMEVVQSTQEISKLLTEGWVLDRCSEKFLKLWTGFRL
jgi:hypothetical protein